MIIKKVVKKIVDTLDLYSPYPLLYPFVMSKDEKKIFDEAVKQSEYYLEFGLGGRSNSEIESKYIYSRIEYYLD